MLILGTAFLVAVAIFTHFGLMAIPFPVAGLLVLINAHRMPSKTAKGTAMSRRIKGFRKFIEESEKDRARFAEQKNLFSEYLPYAIVFGATKKWAKAFEESTASYPRPTGTSAAHPTRCSPLLVLKLDQRLHHIDGRHHLIDSIVLR